MGEKKDPSTQNFKQLKVDQNALAAVETRQDRVCMVAGDAGGVWVDKDQGVSMAGEAISMVVPTESVRVSGIFALNPFSYIPLAPTLMISPPMIGLLYMTKGLAQYTSMLSSLAGGIL
jgi:hypothetical protein